MSAAVASRALVLAATALVVAECTGSAGRESVATSTRAARMCAAALRGGVASARMTTVGDVRAWRVGPNQQPARRSFPGTPDSDPAAWCWTGAAGNFASFAVARGQSFGFGSVGGWTRTPSGPPAFP